jgi:uncharacterized protein (TIGR03382 family)
MQRRVRSFARPFLVLSLGLGLVASARELPNFSIRAQQPTVRFRVPPRGAPGNVAHWDERSTQPTFVWGDRRGIVSTAASALEKKSPADVAARMHLYDYAAQYGLSRSEIDGMEVRAVHDTGDGAIVVQLRQRVGNLEVLGEGLSVVMDRNRTLVAISGSTRGVAPGVANRVTSGFRLSREAVVGSAYDDLVGSAGSRFVAAGGFKGEYQYFQLAGAGAERLNSPVRARPVAFRGLKGLESAYYLELDTRDAAGAFHGYAYVISAKTGKLLSRVNLLHSDAYTYRVFADNSGEFRPWDGPRGNTASPHPTGVPDGSLSPLVDRQLVTLQNGPISTNDPWLPTGATETKGNNVDAYADLDPGDGFTPSTNDIRANVSSGTTFDYPYDNNASPATSVPQTKAAVTSLFYLNNWLHDWYYDAGFDEASGNAQEDNLGRASADLAGDPIHAEADDFSGTNNANMFTPADGASPRMQMYIFNGRSDIRLIISAPPAIAQTLSPGTAQFGPQGFDVSGDVALANDGTAPTSDGCQTPITGVTGKIALIDRGTCAFVLKTKNAQLGGAIGVIIANTAEAIVNMAGTDATINIPTMSVPLSVGNAIKAQLALPATVTVELKKQDPSTVVNLEGSFDNSVMAHEWGHYIAHRLVAGGYGFEAKITNSMGEGWSDFHAMLLIVRPEDINVASNANWSGTYAVGVYDTFGLVQDNMYFAIRRYPYSTNMAKNPLTFKHIGAGVTLPVGPPVSLVVAGTDNTEVHAAGEVWAEMLWECYAALLNAHSFTDAQHRMQRYIVAGYKATPFAATYTEARDAILAVAAASDPADYQTLGQAFARRGLGTGAVAPDRFDTTNGGLTESFFWGPDLYISNATFTDGSVNCDSDNVLDPGETAKVTLVLQNSGSTDLHQTGATLTTTTSGVTLADGGVFGIPTIAAGQTATVTLPVSLALSATSATAVDLSIDVNDPELDAGVAANRPLSLSGSFRVNTDDIPNSSATDDVEANVSAWTVVTAPHVGGNNPWTIMEFDLASLSSDALHHIWFAEDPDRSSDESLVSPPLIVGNAGPLVVTFDAIWDEEPNDATTGFDGVVIEISQDNGTTWKDVTDASVGGTLTPAYNVTLFDEGTDTVGGFNPLQARKAYGNQSPSFPAVVHGTVNLGAAFAGKTVLIRFRSGSDSGGNATGFLLDNISVSGITNTPFSTVAADGLKCTPSAVSAGPAQTINERSQAQLAGTYTIAGATPPTLAWTQVSGPAITLSDPTIANPTFTVPEVTADAVATMKFTVTGISGSANSTVDLTIKDVNRPPVAKITAASSAKKGTGVSLSGTGSSDPDGDALTYAWSQTSGPTVTITGANTASASFVMPDSGPVGIQLKVTDAKGAFTTATQSIGLEDSGCNSVGGDPMPIAAVFLLLLAIGQGRRRRA